MPIRDAIVRILKAHPLKLVGILIGAFLLGGAAAIDEDGLFGQTFAAWVQAIGSVAAIASAVWISKEDRKATRREAIRREAQAALLVLAEAAANISSFVVVAKTPGSEEPTAKEFMRMQAVDLLQAIRSCRFEELPIDLFSEARMAATTGLNCVIAWSMYKQAGASWAKEAQVYHAALTKNLAAIRAAATSMA
jgi:RNase P protein component